MHIPSSGAYEFLVTCSLLCKLKCILVAIHDAWFHNYAAEAYVTLFRLCDK